MQKLKRAVHIDFHTMPGIYNFGEDFDAEIFAQRLKDAHVEIINMFFQCNIGHVYYPTRIGVPYPAITCFCWKSKESLEKTLTSAWIFYIIILLLLHGGTAEISLQCPVC